MTLSAKQPVPRDVKVNIDECEAIKCECEGEEFDIVYKIKKIPALLSRSGGEELLSLAYFRCIKCNKVSKIMKR